MKPEPRAPNPNSRAPDPGSRFPAPTLGGKQFWADEFFFHEWHIQRNVFTGHYRLLDGSNRRHASGDWEHCHAKLSAIRSARQLPAMNGSAVVVLHGLFRSASAMRRLSRYLREQGQFSVFNVNYPTTRGTVTDHARQLAKLLASLEGIERIHFVAHSLGNLVIRHYMADQSDASRGMQPDPRIGRIVMLGPPNQGAVIAEALGRFKLFHLVGGRSASQLARDWAALEARLATPSCPFGILAGGRGTRRGYNPLLGSDNDLVVSVESTRLPGAADFAVLPALHSVMMNDKTVQQYTLSFLQHGYFKSAVECCPIES